jgi:hypothetical protein
MSCPNNDELQLNTHTNQCECKNKELIHDLATNTCKFNSTYKCDPSNIIDKNKAILDINKLLESMISDTNMITGMGLQIATEALFKRIAAKAVVNSMIKNLASGIAKGFEGLNALAMYQMVYNIFFMGELSYNAQFEEQLATQEFAAIFYDNVTKSLRSIQDDPKSITCMAMEIKNTLNNPSISDATLYKIVHDNLRNMVAVYIPTTETPDFTKYNTSQLYCNTLYNPDCISDCNPEQNPTVSGIVSPFGKCPTSYQKYWQSYVNDINNNPKQIPIIRIDEISERIQDINNVYYQKQAIKKEVETTNMNTIDYFNPQLKYIVTIIFLLIGLLIFLL